MRPADARIFYPREHGTLIAVHARLNVAGSRTFQIEHGGSGHEIGGGAVRASVLGTLRCALAMLRGGMPAFERERARVESAPAPAPAPSMSSVLAQLAAPSSPTRVTHAQPLRAVQAVLVISARARGIEVRRG